jgi:hypothetical protein
MCHYVVQLLSMSVSGHTEVLRWAREHGAPWYAVMRDLAATHGYTDELPLSP